MAKGQKKVLSDVEKAKRDAAKRAKFVDLAEKRTVKALKAIAHLEYLGSSNYIHTDDQRRTIVSALSKAVTGVDNALAGTKKDVPAFKLPA